MELKSLIRTIADYPQPGIQFRDVTTLLKDASGFAAVINQLHERYREQTIDVVVGIEARGFIVGAALAYRMGLGFVPIRKQGKLPGDTVEQHYDLEYGTDTVEVHADALDAGARVLLVDDLLATGGTAMAAIHLIERLDARVIATAFVVDLPELKGRETLTTAGYEVFSLVEFSGH